MMFPEYEFLLIALISYSTLCCVVGHTEKTCPNDQVVKATNEGDLLKKSKTMKRRKAEAEIKDSPVKRAKTLQGVALKTDKKTASTLEKTKMSKKKKRQRRK